MRYEPVVREDITVYPIFISADTVYTVTYETLLNGERVERKTVSAKASEIITYTPPTPPLAYTYSLRALKLSPTTESE